jgi:hypothetical protein
LRVSERRVCAALGQHRSTQRKPPRGRDDEAALTADIVGFARTYGRYGYRRITALLHGVEWLVNVKRVERIWRREGLKVPQKQPKRGRLWLADGSCIRLRAEYPRAPCGRFAYQRAAATPQRARADQRGRRCRRHPGGRSVRDLTRLVQRLLVVALGAFAVWLIVFVVFRIADHRLPWVLGLGVTYAVAAYAILPLALRMGLKILQRRRVPRYTVTGDGLPGDPVNVALIGTLAQLRAAFATAGWQEADKLGVVGSWRMTVAFLLNTPYPTAPFSTLYLFGRGQDIGFQKAIDNSPRKRHHVRFWALSFARAEDTLGTAAFWLNTDRPPEDERVLWVGAGTRDTGFALTRLTLKITHATDADTNAERDFVVAELQAHGVIADVRVYRSGEDVPIGRVNRYVTDDDIGVADLAG